MHRGTATLANSGSSCNLVDQTRSSSLQNGSSRPNFLRHKSCKRIFALSITGAMKPSGSYNELTVDRTPLLVNGFSLRHTQNSSSSLLKVHLTPSTRSTGSLPQLRFRNVFALSAGGTLSRMLVRLLSHFVKRNPPLASRAVS